MRKNSYGRECRGCSQPVAAFAGYVERISDNPQHVGADRWTVWCKICAPIKKEWGGNVFPAHSHEDAPILDGSTVRLWLCQFGKCWIDNPTEPYLLLFLRRTDVAKCVSEYSVETAAVKRTIMRNLAGEGSTRRNFFRCVSSLKYETKNEQIKIVRDILRTMNETLKCSLFFNEQLPGLCEFAATNHGPMTVEKYIDIGNAGLYLIPEKE